MNISMFCNDNVQITFKGVSHNVCSEKNKWHIEWIKLEILHFFAIV